MELHCTHAGSCNANQGARVELIFHHPIKITGPVMRPRSATQVQGTKKAKEIIAS